MTRNRRDLCFIPATGGSGACIDDADRDRQPARLVAGRARDLRRAARTDRQAGSSSSGTRAPSRPPRTSRRLDRPGRRDRHAARPACRRQRLLRQLLTRRQAARLHRELGKQVLPLPLDRPVKGGRSRSRRRSPPCAAASVAWRPDGTRARGRPAHGRPTAPAKADRSASTRRSPKKLDILRPGGSPSLGARQPRTEVGRGAVRSLPPPGVERGGVLPQLRGAGRAAARLALERRAARRRPGSAHRAR